MYTSRDPMLSHIPMLGQVVTALLSHYWFSRYEPSVTVAASCLSGFPLFITFLESQVDQNLSMRKITFTVLALRYLSFWATLSASIIAYRISPFHPLYRYPGPLLCKITQLQATWLAVGGKTHTYRKKLHEKYGPIVRIGPNELSITDKDIYPHVLGRQGLPRGPIWDGRRIEVPGGSQKGYDGLIDVRSNKIQHQLRKDWNTAFSSSAVRDYQELLEPRGKQFRDHLHDASLLQKAEGENMTPVDLGQWVSYFSFDFMGDIAYGGCFNLMRQGDEEGIRKKLDEGLVLPFIMQHIPWINRLISKIPLISAEVRNMHDFAFKQARKRMATETKRKDLFHHLYEVTQEKHSRTEAEQMDNIVSHSLLTIVAGSDTTSTTLSAALCFLLSDRKVYDRLREELDSAFPDTTVSTIDGWPDIQIDQLAKLEYLNAVINETLRLVPANPTSLQRAPEPETGGRMLGDTGIYISEGVAVNICTFAMQRDPRYFSPDPDSFNPERWLDKVSVGGEEYITVKEAFIPWSYGPANRAGKALAILELRFILGVVVRCFDVHHYGCRDPEEGSKVLKEKGSAWMEGLKDRFVFEKPGIPAELISRRVVSAPQPAFSM